MYAVLGTVFCALWVGLPLMALLSWAEEPKQDANSHRSSTKSVS